jgi:hypothetical protein
MPATKVEDDARLYLAKQQQVMSAEYYSEQPPESADPRVRQLYAYWLGIHPEGGGLPGRQHVDATAIPNLLPHLWLVDIETEPLRFRYRLFGTEHVNVIGSDLTGRWIDEAHPSFLSSTAYPQFVAAAECGVSGYRSGPTNIILPKEYLTMERLILPLARDGKRVDMLLAISVYHKVRPVSPPA